MGNYISCQFSKRFGIFLQVVVYEVTTDTEFKVHFIFWLSAIHQNSSQNASFYQSSSIIDWQFPVPWLLYSSEKTFDLAMLNLRKDGSASKEPLGLNQEFPPLFSFSSLFWNFLSCCPLCKPGLCRVSRSNRKGKFAPGGGRLLGLALGYEQNQFCNFQLENRK